MKKLLSGLSLSLVLSIPALAQNAHEGSIRFKKEDRNGVIAEYDAPKDNTEDALEARLKAANIGKKHSESGFWKYEGIIWPEIAADKVDVYFNVDRSKGKSEVYMMVSTGYGNFVTTASNPQVIENMKAFLTKFSVELAAYQHDLALAAQKKEVEEADRKLKSANHDAERAARRQKKADREQNKLQEQANDQQKKLQEIQGANPK